MSRSTTHAITHAITHAGDIALARLKGGTGRVIAVFENSMYLDICDNDTALVCLGSSMLPEGPINLRTNLAKLPAVTKDAHWHSTDCTLLIDGAISFDYQTTAITTAKIPNPSHHRLIQTDRAILDLMRSHVSRQPTGSRFNLQVEVQLQSGIATLRDWLIEEPVDPPIQLRKLIGCGEGLTPTGDDILIGALIALHNTGRISHFHALSLWVKEYAATLTNKISLAHLHAACEGKAVCLLHNLLNAACTRDIPGTRTALVELEQYGHRSGQDAVQGALAVLDSTKNAH